MKRLGMGGVFMDRAKQGCEALVALLRAAGSDPSGERCMALEGALRAPGWRWPAKAARERAKDCGARLCLKACGPFWDRRVGFVAKGSEWQLWRFARSMESVFETSELSGANAELICGKALWSPAKPCEGWEMTR